MKTSTVFVVVFTAGVFFFMGHMSGKATMSLQCFQIIKGATSL